MRRAGWVARLDPGQSINECECNTFASMSFGTQVGGWMGARWISPIHLFRRALRPLAAVRAMPQRQADVAADRYPFDRAWIVFELAPQLFRTRAGEIHPIALIEAATCNLLGWWFARSDRLHPDGKAVARPFEQARREQRPRPIRLLVATDRTEDWRLPRRRASTCRSCASRQNGCIDSQSTPNTSSSGGWRVLFRPKAAAFVRETEPGEPGDRRRDPVNSGASEVIRVSRHADL